MKNLLSILILLSFSCKRATVPEQKKPELSLNTQPPSLDEVQQQLIFTLPFPQNIFSLAPDDLYQWDQASIVKYTYTNYPAVEAYFERNKVTGNYSQILYNTNTGGYLKLQITINQVGDSVQKWSLQDSTGIPYTEITVNTFTGQVINEIEGTGPNLSPLGPVDTIENFVCGGNKNISQCAKCVAQVCDDHWQCKILCVGMGAVVCYGVHVGICLIHKAKGDYGDGVIPLIINDGPGHTITKDSLHLLTDSLHH